MPTVTFANTDGRVLTSAEDIIPSNVLGEAILHKDGVYIYDRKPDDEVSRLELTEVMKTISRIRPIYDLQTPMIVYLPKMSRDLYVVGKFQVSLYDTVENIEIRGV